MHQVENCSEVHPLFHREGMANAAIATRLAMSHNTVDRLLALREPPGTCGRRHAASLTRHEAHRGDAGLRSDGPGDRLPRVPLRSAGCTGGIPILKEHIARVRCGYLAAQRPVPMRT